ncbi:MAG: hypothetical protein M1828_001180 [Chrysothrix sp. TS-e1954]|nr:MAG: hypothetical protein M1828_001180 [Chrysothrix sp. TS-e1954]
MPPRKRARLSPASHASIPNTSTPATPSSTQPLNPPTSASADDPDALLLADPWTPEQTTALFRAIIRSKPTGVHRHMHMLQIAQTVQSQAGGNYEHLRLPAIWRKLAGLYELDALNEREEHFARNELMGQKEDVLDSAKGSGGRTGRKAKQKELSEAQEDLEMGSAFWPPELDDEDVAERMQQRRLKASEDEASDGTDEEEQSPARGTRATRGRGRGRGRGGIQSVRTTKTDYVDEELEKDDEDEDANDEESGAGDDGEGPPEGEGSTNASSPAPARGTRSTTTRSSASVRGNRGRGRGGRKR